MDPNVARLLAHGGWEIADPADLRGPEGQPLPQVPADEIARLEPGHGVRVVFGLATLSDGALAPEPPYGPDGVPNLIAVAEQAWLFVVERQAETITALLANTPHATHSRLAPNTLVEVPAARVLQTNAAGVPDLEDLRGRIAAAGFAEQSMAAATVPVAANDAPRIDPAQLVVLAPLGLRPHPVHPASLVIMEREPDQSLPLIGRRSEPDPRHRDSGWVIQAVRDADTTEHEDEHAHDHQHDADCEQCEADACGCGHEHAGHGHVEVGTLEAGVLMSFAPVWAHLALPPGWGFLLPPGGPVRVIDPDGNLIDEAPAPEASAEPAGA